MADDKKDDTKSGPESCQEGDSVTLGPDLGGIRPFVRHRADHEIQMGIALPAQDGRGTLHLKHRSGDVYDVQAELPGGGVSGSKKGPAQVSSSAYRAGWEKTFSGTKTVVGQA